MFVIDKAGRRLILSSSLLISGAACLATGLVPEDAVTFQVVCSLLGKFFATLAFDTVYSFTTELFPTHCRTFTTGMCSTFGRLGSIAAPFVADLGRTQDRAIPFIIFAIVSLAAGTTSATLPETNNIPLPSNIKEAKALNKHALPCFRCVKDD